MKSSLLFATASACLLGASSVQAALNLVQDPTFNVSAESGLTTVAGAPVGVVQAASTPWGNPAYFAPFITDDNVFIIRPLAENSSPAQEVEKRLGPRVETPRGATGTVALPILFRALSKSEVRPAETIHKMTPCLSPAGLI